MTYVGIYEALRIIVRTLPGGEDLAVMNDGWIRRSGVAFLPPEGAYLVPIFQRAVALLEQSIQSPDVDVIVCERKIAPHERGYRLELREAMLIHPFGRAPLTDILICVDDLKRCLAPPIAEQIEAGPPKRAGKGGRKPIFDLGLIDVVQDLSPRRHPTKYPVPGWSSVADVIKAVNEYLVKEGIGEMSPSRARARSPLGQFDGILETEFPEITGDCRVKAKRS